MKLKNDQSLTNDMKAIINGMEMSDTQKNTGSYLGTEIDSTWWKRYKSDGFFARGAGHYWLDKNGLYFHRLLTKEPLFIAFKNIQSIKLGKWHAGKWVCRHTVLKINWRQDGMKVSSGFVLASSKEETLCIKQDLEQKIQNPLS